MPTRGPETGLDPTDTGRVALRVTLPPAGVLTTNQRLHWGVTPGEYGFRFLIDPVS